MKTELQTNLSSLENSELKKVAKALGTSENYLMGHIYYARRIPKPKLMIALKVRLNLNDADMYTHFYEQSEPETAA